MSFRDNLLHLRASSNMTQEQLAMMLGVSRQSVTKWESERTYPEMDKLLKMCQIFNCSLDDLVQGDLTKTAVHPTVPGPSAPPADVFGYDEHMRNFARRISNGVMAIILAVGISILFFSWSESSLFGFQLLDNMSAAIGVFCIFIGVIAGLASIIPAAIQHSAFVKAHPYVEDFYTEEEKTQARGAFSFELIGGIGAIFLGICIIVFLSDTAYEGTVGVPLMMVCIAIGVRFIVHGGIALGRTNLEEYNRSVGEMLEPAEIERANVSEEQRQEMMKTHKVEKRISAVCGIIMITATIIALLMLFLPLASGSPDYTQGPIALFWLPWPIGGMLCGIAALVIKSLDSK